LIYLITTAIGVSRGINATHAVFVYDMSVHYTCDCNLETASIRCPMRGDDSLERIEI